MATMRAPLSLHSRGKHDNLPFSVDKSKRRRRIWLFSRRNIKIVVGIILLPSLALYYLVRRSFQKSKTVKEQVDFNQKLDFIVAGFPKCGTTTLLYAFKDHSEISISERENCQIARPLQQDDINLKRLGMDLAELLPGKKRGIKCPDTLKNFKAIHRLVQHSPDCQFIIGLRHPMTQLQSFYNYRITEIYDKHLPKEDIPDLLDILTERHPPWKDVSIDSSRFELYLLQFGKTNMTIDDLELLMNNKMLAIRPNHFPIFLYTLDQINDADEHRSRQFRKDLQQFMGLSRPLQPLGHENLNHFVGQKAHKETIDICQERFDTIRKTLVENSQTTAAWIRNVFLQSPEVTISNRAHFLQSLESWNEDPCTQ